jgi:TP901 family phage tail tape measure protein
MSAKRLYVEVTGNVAGLVASLGKGAAAVEEFGGKVNAAGVKYSAALTEAEKSSRGYTTVGKGLAVVGGLVALGFADATHKYMEFSAQMAVVQALTRANSSEMALLTHAALTMGQSIGFSATEVAQAETELVKAGIGVSDILGGALKGSLDLAAAGQTDVASATETAAIAMTQFKLKGSDIPHVADLLAAGADRALGSVADLSAGLRYGGSAAAQAGWSIEQTVGTLAELAQAGQLGSRGGMELQQMFRSLQKPNSQAQAMMQKYGITVYQANGQMVNSVQLAGELHDKLGKLTPAQRNAALATMFTSNAVRAANVLMAGGASANAKWIQTVNQQGFAAMQAAGKMNSLSGDLQKLGAAFDNALIGVGATSQGPLRVLVQDLTSVVQWWNNLPGPVKEAVVILGLAGTAAALAGGAALMAVPKWAAMNAALVATGRDAITASDALGMIGKATAVMAVITGIYEGAKALGHELSDDTTPSVDEFTTLLAKMAQQGSAGPGGAAMLSELQDVAQGAGTSFGLLGQATKNIDTALAGLVTSGHANEAASSFSQINTALRAAGLSTAQITTLFPAYSSALSNSASQAAAAGDGIDQYGNAVNKAAKRTATATADAKAYNDALHALTDPLFALNQALVTQAQKQDAATKATQKYGAGSKQAKQANLDLASATADVDSAVHSLEGSVKSGGTTMSKAKSYLDAWVKSSLITKAQAKSIADSFRGLIKQANTLSKNDPHVTVTADTSQASHALGGLLVQIAHLHSTGITTAGGALGGGRRAADTTRRPVRRAARRAGREGPRRQGGRPGRTDHRRGAGDAVERRVRDPRGDGHQTRRPGGSDQQRPGATDGARRQRRRRSDVVRARRQRPVDVRLHTAGRDEHVHRSGEHLQRAAGQSEGSDQPGAAHVRLRQVGGRSAAVGEEPRDDQPAGRQQRRAGARVARRVRGARDAPDGHGVEQGSGVDGEELERLVVDGADHHGELLELDEGRVHAVRGGPVGAGEADRPRVRRARRAVVVARPGDRGEARQGVPAQPCEGRQGEPDREEGQQATHDRAARRNASDRRGAEGQEGPGNPRHCGRDRARRERDHHRRGPGPAGHQGARLAQHTVPVGPVESQQGAAVRRRRLAEARADARLQRAREARGDHADRSAGDDDPARVLDGVRAEP